MVPGLISGQRVRNPLHVDGVAIQQGLGTGPFLPPLCTVVCFCASYRRSCECPQRCHIGLRSSRSGRPSSHCRSPKAPKNFCADGSSVLLLITLQQAPSRPSLGKGCDLGRHQAAPTLLRAPRTSIESFSLVALWRLRAKRASRPKPAAAAVTAVLECVKTACPWLSLAEPWIPTL